MKLYFFIYYSILTVVISLHYFFRIRTYIPLSLDLFISLIFIPLLGFIISNFFPLIRFKNAFVRNSEVPKLMQYLFIFWLFSCFIDICINGVPPILSLKAGSYATYGTRGLGGMLNMISLLLLPYFFLSCKPNKNKKFIVIFLTLLYQIITLRRGHFIFFSTYLFLIHLLVNRSKLKFSFILPFSLFIFSIIFIFGYLGDYRGAYGNPFLGLYEGYAYEILGFLPSGFTWFLTYLISPFNNFLSIAPEFCGNELLPILSLLPSPIQSNLEGEFFSSNCLFLIPDSNLNMVTGFPLFKNSLLFAPFYITFILYTLRLSSYYWIQSNPSNIFIPALIALSVLVIISNFFTSAFFIPTYAFAFVSLLILSSYHD